MEIQGVKDAFIAGYIQDGVFDNRRPHAARFRVVFPYEVPSHGVEGVHDAGVGAQVDSCGVDGRGG